jgi:RNA polymerase sigma-70 factor (ECF subfamily)
MRSPSSRRGLAEPLAATTPDVDAGAEERAIREEMGECIRALVDRLPSEYRAVIVLGDLEGLTAREIAEVLGTTVGAAKIKLHRARARLKEALEEGCRLSRDGGGDLGCEPRPLRILSRPPLVNTGREGGLEP